MDFQLFIEYVRVVSQLVFMEGILSLDNAAIIGAMAATLPTQAIPLPTWMLFARRFFDRLGLQPQAALKVGMLGAYVGRGLMLLIATWIVQYPLIKVIGAAYLIKLALKHLGEPDQAGEHMLMQKQKHAGFWMTVLSIETMDLIFSIDNVIAAVAISPNLYAVYFGVAIGILIMRFAATLFMKLIAIEPRFTTAAYILILQIGVELVISEVYHIHFEGMLKFGISLATIALTFIYGRIGIFRLITRPVFVWFGQGLGNINELVDWALLPITATGSLAWRYVTSKKQVIAVPASDD